MALAIPLSSRSDMTWPMSGSASASSWARWLITFVCSLVSRWRSRHGSAVHGERVVGGCLEGADQLVLVFHGIQQGLAVRFACELGTGLRPHGRALSGEVEAQLIAEHDPRARAAVRPTVVC